MEDHNFETTAPHILVVDDDPQFVGLVNTWLERANYRVTSAYSGEQALNLLGCPVDESPPPSSESPAPAKPTFDLVVLDVMMPGLSGTQVCHHIRANASTAQLPVLVLTALSSSQERIRALEAGANDYITKPFQGVELLARADNLVRWRRAELKVQTKMRQRNRELNALNEVATTLNQTLNLRDLLRQTLSTVCQVTDFPWGAIHLLDHTGHYLELAVHQDTPPAFAEDQRRIPRDESLMWQVIEQMRPIATEPLTCSELESSEKEVQKATTCNYVLLAAKGQPVGLLTVGHHVPQTLSAQAAQLLGAIGHQIGTAVANASLFEQVQQQVTELTALTRELERSQAQLVQSEKMAAVGRLAASLAHEINNPLQAIHNCLTLTQRFSLDAEEHTDFLKLAGEEVERLINIVQRTLEFYRPSKGHRASTDVNNMVEHVVALIQKKLQHSDVELHLNLAEVLPPVHVVADQISQVLLNLIINAIEAMPDGGQIELLSREGDNGWVEVSVSDSGPGLSQEQIDNAFEPFFTTKKAGTGLGLAISFGIVERHGGTIQVTSIPGDGATFTVRLPVALGNEKDN